MAYFGRTAKKPQSVPGAASGDPVGQTEDRVQRAERRASAGRAERPGRLDRQVRQNRIVRDERKAR